MLWPLSDQDGVPPGAWSHAGPLTHSADFITPGGPTPLAVRTPQQTQARLWICVLLSRGVIWDAWKREVLFWLRTDHGPFLIRISEKKIESVIPVWRLPMMTRARGWVTSYCYVRPIRGASGCQTGGLRCVIIVLSFIATVTAPLSDGAETGALDPQSPVTVVTGSVLCVTMLRWKVQPPFIGGWCSFVLEMSNLPNGSLVLGQSLVAPSPDWLLVAMLMKLLSPQCCPPLSLHWSENFNWGPGRAASHYPSTDIGKLINWSDLSISGWQMWVLRISRWGESLAWPCIRYWPGLGLAGSIDILSNFLKRLPSLWPVLALVLWNC